MHNNVNHINLASWHGNMKVSQVILQTCWKLGKLQIEKEFPFVASILHIATTSAFDIFCPLSTNLVKAVHDVQDYNNTIDGISALPSERSASEPDLKDTTANEDTSKKHDPCFELEGNQVYKSQYFNRAFTSYKKCHAQTLCVMISWSIRTRIHKWSLP